MARTNRQKMQFLVKASGAAVALFGLALVVFVPWTSSVTGMLEDVGFTRLVVERTGPFNFRFSGMRGADQCFGSVTKTPGAIVRIGEVCVEPRRKPRR